MYKCWRLFRRGKIASREIIEFEYFLEDNLRRLEADLAAQRYRHGGYRQFEVIDSKRRIIKVAAVRDRVVHRLIYEYLKPIFDKMFIYDVWSCRKGKGLIAAVKRSQEFFRRHLTGYVWRSDIRKFFDNINKEILLNLIKRKVTDGHALGVIKEIIFSLPAQYEMESKARGIPIGNLTSQIFANIYLNEFDRFVKHDLKVKRYLRYGDDFIILADNGAELNGIRLKAKEFLNKRLRLEVNDRHDIIIKTNRGLKFLGAIVYPWDCRLNRRNRRRLRSNLTLDNIPSYRGLISRYEAGKLKEFDWRVAELLRDL